VIGASLSLPALSFNTLSHDLLASFQPDSAYLHPSETRTGAVLPQIAPDAGTGIVSAAQRPRPVLWNSCGAVCASLEMVAFGEEGHTRTGAVSGFFGGACREGMVVRFFVASKTRAHEDRLCCCDGIPEMVV
jgi:hypothetical protein